jgi:hypothetical protein
MSLAGPRAASLNDAIDATTNAGIVVVTAAGECFSRHASHGGCLLIRFHIRLWQPLPQSMMQPAWLQQSGAPERGVVRCSCTGLYSFVEITIQQHSNLFKHRALYGAGAHNYG